MFAVIICLKSYAAWSNREALMKWLGPDGQQPHISLLGRTIHMLII